MSPFHFTPPIAALASLALLAGGAGAEAAGLSGRAQSGHALALSVCARCHAVEAEGASPRPHATPFRDIAQIYDERTLASEFDAIGRLGHYEMPPTPIGVRDRAALSAYIASFRRPVP